MKKRKKKRGGGTLEKLHFPSLPPVFQEMDDRIDFDRAVTTP